MDFIKALILGIVEGVTEFLPVSSTGHLILVNEFLNLEPASFANAFNVMIQLGAILSVVVLYFDKLNPFKFSREKNDRLPENYGEMNFQSKIYYAVKYRKKESMEIWKKVIIGVIPAGVLGLLFDDFIDAHLFTPTVVGTMLFIWGLIIIVIEAAYKDKAFKYESIIEMPWMIVVLIGFFQAMAMIPGTSRSAATIMGAIILGASRGAAAEFSFFLAIPTMLGATLLKIIKMGLVFSHHQWAVVFFGGLISFLVALYVIRGFMNFIREHDFKVFGIYRIILSIFVYFVLIR